MKELKNIVFHPACVSLAQCFQWEHLSRQHWAGFAVKASGLSAGKGVIVADTAADACQAVDTISSSFGEAGQTIVVEEKLVGEEISVSAQVIS